MKAKDFRKLAVEKMAGKNFEVIVTYLLFTVLVGLLTSTFVGALLLSGPLTLGFCLFIVDVSSGNKLSVGRLLGGLDNFFTALLLYVMKSIFVFLWSLLFIIPGIIKSYSYTMSYYILIDNPDIESGEAITRSRTMMSGHKWRLFCLHFSYIGWLILSMFTFGILLLWVIPRMEVAKYEFYLDLKNR
jgi:uncharacterized membrane protein